MTREPSKERGCDGKANLGREYVKQADRLAKKHGKRYGVYRCPHCQGAHVTTKLEKAEQYAELLHITPIQDKVMYFVEFYHKGLDGSLIPACGDRSVIILDGREARWKHHDIAREEGKKRGYTAYKLCRGETLNRGVTSSGLFPIT